MRQDPLTPGVSLMTYTKSQPLIPINQVANNSQYIQLKKPQNSGTYNLSLLHLFQVAGR